MHDFIIIIEESPGDAMRRKAAEHTVRTLRTFVAALEPPEARALAGALLDLSIAAANCLAQSEPHELDTDGFWTGRPPATAAHVHAAVLRIALGHQAGTVGALACIEDANTVIRDTFKAG